MDVLLQNFIAGPLKDNDGVEDLLSWECAIPGPPKVSASVCQYIQCLYLFDSFAYGT